MVRETWSDRWFRWTGTDAFYWGTGAGAFAVTAWMAWPLAWSILDLVIVLLIACVVWPLFLIVIVGPAGVVITVLCALLDMRADVTACRRAP